MCHNYRGRGPGGARDRRPGGARRQPPLWTLIGLALLIGSLATVVACASGPSPGPSTVTAAYESAHPTGGLPSSLRAIELSRDEVGRRLATEVRDGVRILLPLHLPPGFRPAAPYIAVGDGTARPNPESWGGSYRVSYTDGRGLLVVTVGAFMLPDGVVWSGRHLRIDGRPARAGRAGEERVVATVDGRPRVLVTGLSVARAEVLATARSLAGRR